jgi:hypothetical protein
MMDIDLWGVKKDEYNFGDLAMWLQNGGTLYIESDGDYQDRKGKGRKGKGKRKEQVDVQDKRKEKGKERVQDKEKRAHKKKNSQKLK